MPSHEVVRQWLQRSNLTDDLIRPRAAMNGQGSNAFNPTDKLTFDDQSLAAGRVCQSRFVR